MEFLRPKSKTGDKMSNFFKGHFFFFSKNTFSTFFFGETLFMITQTSVNKRISKLAGLAEINILFLPQTKYLGFFFF